MEHIYKLITSIPRYKAYTSPKNWGKMRARQKTKGKMPILKSRKHFKKKKRQGLLMKGADHDV